MMRRYHVENVEFLYDLIGRCSGTLKNVISEHKLQIKFMSNSYDISFGRMPWNTYGDKLTLAPVMAWCRQAPSHNLNHK